MRRYTPLRETFIRTYVTHVGCECGSVSHVSQNETQFMYNYKLNDAIHTNNVQLFTHSSMRENYIITILDLYPLTFRLHTWHINPLVCKALNTGVLGASLLLVRLQLPGTGQNRTLTTTPVLPLVDIQTTLSSEQLSSAATY